MNKKTIVKILLILLFLGCFFAVPYGYFMLVRFLGMVGFIILAYYDEPKEDKTLMIIWIVSAVLINPILRLPLGRAIWNIIDMVWIFGLLLSLLMDRKK
ncbi:MAG: hypothetical protein QM528_05175 [Phycisphaerales bacterium]|nr:hypothetical protein [Phycisphaerales bacterium]